MKNIIENKKLVIDCNNDKELYDFYRGNLEEAKNGLYMYRKAKDGILNFKIDFGKTASKAKENPVLGGIMGLCVADALGVPVEGASRDKLKKVPVKGMDRKGRFGMAPGTWSDDSSLTLCLADSLARGFDYKDMMNKFSDWLFHGKFTPQGEAFGIGNGTYRAIMSFDDEIEPLLCGGKEEGDNGNGSLMRILPLVFYIRAELGKDFIGNKVAMDAIDNVSSLTHAHKRSVVACGIYLSIASRLLDGEALDKAVSIGFENAIDYYAKKEDCKAELHHFQRISEPDFKDLAEKEIRSSGYVVDTLEAALWCLLNTASYKDCVLKAVNLGEDTDTVGAVAGGLAGIRYGYKSIPDEWLEHIVKKEMIISVCENLIKEIK